MQNHIQSNIGSLPLEFHLDDINASFYQQQLLSGPGSITHPPMIIQHHLPMGSRRRSPDELIPLDAPTQSRHYVTPSSTSKKEIPAFFNKRRYNCQPSDEEEDELTEEPLASSATDQEKIDWKRRQNTLAARRSRKRKMLLQHRLEDTVERLTLEKEVWRTRALTLKQLLHSHGIPCPEFQD